MSVPIISFIIPIFNGEKYINRCLNSIFSLPLSEEQMEVIVIDDCSSDNTPNILDEYASNYPNMVVLKQEQNQRQGAARNRGLNIAKGKYIAFADADDEIVAEGYIQAISKNKKADIIFISFEYENSDNEWKRFYNPIELLGKTISAMDYLNNYYNCYYNAPWRCIYLNHFLQTTGIKFVEGVRWEDCDWTVKVLSKAKLIQFVDGIGYKYHYNPYATSQEKSSCAMAERIYAGTRLVNLALELRHTHPSLADTLEWEGMNRYVVNELRLRNVTKYPTHVIHDMYNHLGKYYINNNTYKWPTWIHFMFEYKRLALLLLSILYPFACIGRKMSGYFR